MLSQTPPDAGRFRLSTLALVLLITGLISSAPMAQELSAMKSPANLPGNLNHDKSDKDVNKETGKSENKTDAKLSPAEAAKMMEALEERIRLLEEKLAKLNSAPPAKSSTMAGPVAAQTDDTVKAETIAEIKKEVAAIQDDAKKNDGLLKFLKDVEISGIVDGYYSYNNNKVDMFTQGRAFDVRHDSFSLQLAKVTLNRANSKDSPLGFRVDLGLGETVDRVISVSDSSRNDATKHILQAYASYVAPIGSGLTMDFGKFYTPIGAEVIETKDNFNYSRGWLFTYGPYYHTGARAKYSFNDKAALTGFLVNGWDNMFENNVRGGFNKTIGAQLALTPTKKFALAQTYLVGREAPLANVPDLSDRDNYRHIADTVASVYVTDKFTLLGNFVAGWDGDNLGNRGHWTGFAAYFKYAFNDRFAFSPRFEILNDKDGLRTGVAQSVKDITLTGEMKLINNLISRFEFRRDFSNQRFFTNSVGEAKGSQNTVILGISYFFTNREQ